MEPILEQYRPVILASLKFSKFTLGTVAPQFTGPFDPIALDFWQSASPMVQLVLLSSECAYLDVFVIYQQSKTCLLLFDFPFFISLAGFGL